MTAYSQQTSIVVNQTFYIKNKGKTRLDFSLRALGTRRAASKGSFEQVRREAGVVNRDGMQGAQHSDSRRYREHVQRSRHLNPLVRAAC